MTDCPRCQARTWPHAGDRPRCSFPDGVFDPDGWNCATMAELRTIAEEAGPTWSCDQHAATLPWDGEFLILGWYKNRGRTEYAGILSDSDVRPLTLASADEFLAWDAEVRAAQAPPPGPAAGPIIATMTLSPMDRVHLVHSERVHVDITDHPELVRLRTELEWFADEGHYSTTYRRGAGFVDACGLTQARRALGRCIECGEHGHENCFDPNAGGEE